MRAAASRFAGRKSSMPICRWAMSTPSASTE
jgi:hypothetical protein